MIDFETSTVETHYIDEVKGDIEDQLNEALGAGFVAVQLCQKSQRREYKWIALCLLEFIGLVILTVQLFRK